MTTASPTARKLLWVSVFGIAFAFVESSVVAYLRALYYPEGFTFPLKLMTPQHLLVELSREAATIIMLVAVGVLAGRKAWERFGYFMVAFGIWDIFYYVWLKVVLDWPARLDDWDILFLMPLPWIGPVIAPVLISLLMTVCGAVICLRVERELFFRPRAGSWILSSLGTLIILYSFMADTPATVHGHQPLPYHYGLLGGGLILYIAAFILACRSSVAPQGDTNG